MRTCITCEHFKFKTGTEPVGEVNCDWVSVTCEKNKWKFDVVDADQDEFCSTMLAAEYCHSYSAVDYVPLDVDSVKGENVSLPELAAIYPEYEIGLEMETSRVGRWRAWYDKGQAGRARSKWFSVQSEAFAWLAVRLAQMTAVEVPSAVEAR
jgi:hypothetical protein